MRLLLFAVLTVSPVMISHQAFGDARMDALRLLDRGEYDRAIGILWDLHRGRPLDRSLRVQLASAYAARAGLRLESFIGLARELVNSSRDLEKLYEERIARLLDEYKRQTKNRAEVDALETVDRVYRTSFRLANLMRQFSAIPVIRDRGAQSDLHQAISILAEDPALSGGAALYRALLRVTWIRATFENDQRLLQARDCRLQLAPAVAFITDLHREVRGVLEDVSLATNKRKNRDEMAKAIRNLDQGLQDVLQRAKALSNEGEINIREVMLALGGTC